MELAWRLARRLGDGRFHSGQTLASELGVSRSTVWNALQGLRDRGLLIHAVRRKGYRLPEPVSWLAEDRVSAAVPGPLRERVAIEVLPETDSTNNRLLTLPPPAPGSARVCLAEYQSVGRGRRGRRWWCPPGAGICLSLAWQFDRPPPDLSALSVVAGLAVRESLLSIGFEEVMIKWPNDLVAEGRKLGGLLVELRAEGNGPCHVVIGIGVNHRLPVSLESKIRQEGGLVPIDLVSICRAGPPDRNEVAGRLIGDLMERLNRFAVEGARALVADWRSADALNGRLITVDAAGRRLSGRAAGIDRDGALRVELDGRVERITAGDVSVRLAP